MVFSYRICKFETFFGLYGEHDYRADADQYRNQLQSPDLFLEQREGHDRRQYREPAVDRRIEYRRVDCNAEAVEQSVAEEASESGYDSYRCESEPAREIIGKDEFMPGLSTIFDDEQNREIDRRDKISHREEQAARVFDRVLMLLLDHGGQTVCQKREEQEDDPAYRNPAGALLFIIFRLIRAYRGQNEGDEQQCKPDPLKRGDRFVKDDERVDERD